MRLWTPFRHGIQGDAMQAEDILDWELGCLREGSLGGWNEMYSFREPIEDGESYFWRDEVQ